MAIIAATHKKTDVRVLMQYESIEDAKSVTGTYFTDYEYVGF